MTGGTLITNLKYIEPMRAVDQEEEIVIRPFEYQLPPRRMLSEGSTVSLGMVAKYQIAKDLKCPICLDRMSNVNTITVREIRMI